MKWIFLLCIFACSCVATSYYISPFGNNENSGSSPSSAFLDLATALNVSSPGDFIHAAAGTYTGNDNIYLPLDGVTLIGAGSTKTIFQGNTNTLEDYIFLLSNYGSIQNLGLSTATDGLHVITNANISSISITDMSWSSISLMSDAVDIFIDDLSVNGGIYGITMYFTSLETLVITNSYFTNVNVGVSLVSNELKTFKVIGCEFNGMGDSNTAINRVGTSSYDVDFEITNSTIRNYSYATPTVNGIYIFTAETINVAISYVLFSNLTCNNGCSIFTSGNYINVDVQNSIFKDSLSSQYGTIYLESGDSASFSNCQFINCITNGNGGAIYKSQAFGTQVTIDSCLFQSNEASYNGGAIATFSDISITDSKFFQNSATLGGAIFASSSLTISDSDLTQNVASNGGGAYLTGDNSNTFSFTDCIIIGNTVSVNGGGIHCGHGTVQLSDVIIDKNTANGDGGGIYIDTSSVTAVKGLFRNNYASSGGGVYIGSSPATANFKSTIFGDNEAHAEGGGLICENDASLFMQYIVFEGNEGSDGSAYYCNECSITSLGVRVNPDNSVSGC